ncbi:MAG: hypothetical protein RIG61_08565 [Deltaproteobacteria bacterium]
MNKSLLTTGLILSLILTAFIHSSPAQDSGFSASQVQRNFTESVKSLPNVIQASWQSPVDFWVYADGVSKENAEAVADKVILLAQTELGQSLCVHIHNGDYNPLATKCWSSL